MAAQEVYWEVFNGNGGYQGWTVEPVVLDSGYQTDVGIQNYETLAQESEDGVLMITENTGSPITAAIAEQAAEDNVLVIPLSLGVVCGRTRPSVRRFSRSRPPTASRR